MRELIERFQIQGDKEIIKYILNLVEEDMLPFRSIDEKGNIHVELDEPLKYVAYRIKAMKELMTKKARSLQAGNIEGRRNLLDFAQTLSEDSDWLGVNYDEVYAGNYKSITENWEEIAEYLTPEVAADLKNLLNNFSSLKILVETGKQEIRDMLQPIIITALEHALTYIDVKKSDKEIVKYINIAWLTKFIRIQVEQNGLKRVQRKGNITYVKPIFSIEEVDIGVLLFNKTLDHIGGINNFKKYLNKNQIALVEELYTLISNDIQKNKHSKYYFDNDGKPILNKRYIAVKIGIEESNFKHKLRRIEKKIKENFRNIVNEKLT